jgi:hypothetical protein
MIMPKKTLLLLAAAMVNTFLPAHAQDNSAQSQLEALAHLIESDGIGSVEIFGVPEDALFAVNLSPESLEKAWDYKLILRSSGALQIRTQALEAAMRVAKLQPTGKKIQFLDVRMGIVFYSKQEGGNRISSLYFDKTGRSGAVGGTSVSFGPEFLPSLKKALHFSI